MSEIITDKLTGKTSAGDVDITSEGGAVTMQLQQGVAKFWINFKGTGTPLTIRDSFNAASITDNGTGDYSANFTSSMSNNDFAASGIAGRDNYNCTLLLHEDDLSHNTGYVIVFTAATSNQAGVNSTHVNVAVHGDLA